MTTLLAARSRFFLFGALSFFSVMAPPDDSRAEEVTPARFHHVRLNVTDVERSLRFYRNVFGAVPIKFNNAVDGLFTERSFLLFNVVEAAPDPTLDTGIWHIGWGGVDVKNEYEWWKSHNVDIHTPLSPLPGRDNFYMYINGPDKELIEINTMGHHRFAHVHFFADDVNAACDWYRQHLGLKPRAAQVRKPPPATEPRQPGDPRALADIWINVIPCDNVTMIFFGKPDADPPPFWWPDPPLQEIRPTQGRPINHIAFSYRQVEPVFERMRAAGATIVEPIAVREPHKIKSFFVEGPDRVLIEIVEAKPIPEGLWDE